MKQHIAKQLITDKNNTETYYEILDAENNAPFNDCTCANTVERLFSSDDMSADLKGKKIFVKFTRELLIKNIPTLFNPENTIIEIYDNVFTDSLIYPILTKYKNMGFCIAVIDTGFNPKYLDALDIVDYIKISFKDFNGTVLENTVKLRISLKKKIIAYDINDKTAFEKAVSLDCALFEGTYIEEKTPLSTDDTDYMKDNFFMLTMLAVTSDDLDSSEEAEEIILNDPYLSKSVLNLAGSDYFVGKSPVKSVKSALEVLGQGKLRQWIYILSFRQNNNIN